LHIRSQRGTELQSRDPVYHAQEVLLHDLKSFDFLQQALALVGGWGDFLLYWH
jgi:hypothetical protein